MVRPILIAALLLLSLNSTPLAAHGHPGRATIMATATKYFIGQLTPEQKSLTVRPLSDNAARTSWHYLPEDLTPRAGITLAQLTGDQRKALHTMLVAAMSSQGYGKLTQIMGLEEVLRTSEGAALKTTMQTGEALKRQEARLQSRDPSKYWLLVFGEPGSADWGWTFSGHHFAVNFTVVKGRVAFTPMFLGANPQTRQDGEYVGMRTMQHEIDKAFRLVGTLAATQRRAALISTAVPNSIVSDKGRKAAVTQYVGIRADQLEPTQQVLLMELIDEFLGDTSEEIAAAQRDSIARDGLASLHFAWWGSAANPAERFMYRIHGPSILIELVREHKDGRPENHLHAIVRDPRNDYGESWLQRHYEEYHPDQR